MVDTKSNLLITKIFTRQIFNNSHIRYTISDEKVLQMGSHRTRALQEKNYDSQDLTGLEWTLHYLIMSTNLIIWGVYYYEHDDGYVSFKMSNYHEKVKIGEIKCQIDE